MILVSIVVFKTDHSAINIDGCIYVPIRDFIDGTGAARLRHFVYLINPIIVADDLYCWNGMYSYSEFAEPNMNMSYQIYIYRGYDGYIADIFIDGSQTMKRLQAKVLGDSSEIKLVFANYLDENIGEEFSVGDTLLVFKKNENGKVLTIREKLQPMLYENVELKDIFFEKCKEPYPAS